MTFPNKNQNWNMSAIMKITKIYENDYSHKNPDNWRVKKNHGKATIVGKEQWVI